MTRRLARDETARVTTVFLHAHPDDEAIFTGGTIARLVEHRERVVVVFATDGALGGDARVRATEIEAAALALGVDEVVQLDYPDSGLSTIDPRSFAAAAINEVADHLVTILDDEDATTLVTYDEFGIYGHPDHVHVHRVGRAVLARRACALYEATVDHEYLHFVETHLVSEARAAAAQTLGHIGATVGLPSVLIDTTVDVRDAIEVKRAAMAAHASQIPPTASAMRLSGADFAAVYGHEWYLRHGPRGSIESL